MNLIEALNIVKAQVAKDAPEMGIFLACGFTPLHMQTYLHSFLRQRFPNHRIRFENGVYGDLAGNLRRALEGRYDCVVALIEWSDIDLRLGIRSLGTWRADHLSDVLQSAEQQVERLKQSIAELDVKCPCVVALPTLPLPPLFPQRTAQASQAESHLRQLVADLGASIASNAHARLVSAQALEEVSPLRGRFDVRSEIMSGFPYNLTHVEALSRLLADLIQDPVPKKGLITDLDDTLWSGILGEIGPENVSWDLAGNALLHGLYQQFLESLASTGVLLAVASKNDPVLADQTLERSDLILSKKSVYPIECNWSKKSESVERILAVWNISSDAVVFVDDSPMEVAEVQAAFPQIDCRVFPKNDPQGVLQLLRELRDIFGKNRISADDALRLESIRFARTLERRAVCDAASEDGFLRDSMAAIVFEMNRKDDARAFELLNKTNQFNLNGRRLTEGEWTRYLGDPAAFLLSVQYEDKYGRLGKIAAVLGRRNGEQAVVDYWVMSCRAFSRRIEHACLKHLFDNFNVKEALLEYRPTERNGPVREFLKSLAPLPLASPVRLLKEDVGLRLPQLYHRVEDASND